MKKTLLLIISFISFGAGYAQTTSTSAPALSAKEKAMNDALCDCLTKADVSKIKSKTEATTVFNECMVANMNLMLEIAEEKNVSMEDQPALRALGMEIGKNLFRQKCLAFSRLSIMMGDTKNKLEQETTKDVIGVFKRLDTKGFNYAIISVSGSEKAMLWLKQFANSELLMNPAALSGKKVKITYQEYEAYLPQAKGYYNVKEITGIELVK